MPIDKMFKLIKQVIKKEYQIEIEMNTPLKELACDSLDRLELLMKIEDALDVNIPENLITENSTIKELLDFKQ
jgi:acyl carrier protein